MTSDLYRVKDSPFDVCQKAMTNFCHNLFLSRAVAQCIHELTLAEAEYQEALTKEDARLVDKKKAEVRAYESSLVLTAYMLDAEDEIST